MRKGMWLACIAAAGLLPLAALAHAKLLSTAPAADEQLAAAPKQLTLRFNEAVQLGVLKLSADGKDIPIALDRGAAAAAAATVSVALPALVPATYRVQWSALTVDDGHVVKGTFSFVVTGAH
jgi:methionine-rich copper-binding protein CopC